MRNILKIAICEDDENDACMIKQSISKTGIPAIVTVYANGRLFLQEYFSGRFDMVFMDIYMDDENGLEIAAKIREYDRNILISFVTYSADHSLEAYKYRSILYLQKPVNADMLAYCLNIADAVREKRNRQILRFSTGDRQTLEIPYHNILYIEGINHRCLLHLNNSRIIETAATISLETLDKQLPDNLFLRCHRSYIVNLEHVEKITKKDFLMSNGDLVLIRVRYYKQIKNDYESFLCQYVRGEII